MFQVRIVTVDHYMCPPIEDLDLIYSEFRKSSIKQVPVIRIFGTTPTGEKTCVHVHGVFPYICIPYDGSEPHMKLSYQLAASLDKAINIASGYSNSNTQHVYKVVLVSGIPFYGYHRSKHQYLKVYFYKPSVVKQAVSLLQNGAIMNKIYQPHEAHIPFVLQFFIDFNLYGMSFIDLENVKFRKTNYPELLANISADSFLPETVAAVSCSQYEVDVAAADILNRPSSQGNGEISNPGIAAIWEDEKRRRALTQGIPLAIPQLHSQRPPLTPTTSELFYLRRLEAILNIASQSSDDNFGESISNKSYAIEEPLLNPALDASFVSLHAMEAFPHQNLVDTIVDEDLALRNSPLSQHSLNKSLALDHEDFELLDVLESLADTRPAIVDDDSVLGSQTIRAKTSEENSDDSGDDEKWQDKTLVVEEDDALRLFDLTMPEIDENLLLNNMTHEPQPGSSRLQQIERESHIPQVDGINDICNKSCYTRRKKKIPQVDGLNDLKKKPGRKSLGMRGGLNRGSKASNSYDRYRPGGGLIFETRKSIVAQSSDAPSSNQSEIGEPSQCPLSFDNIISTLGDKLFTENAAKTSDVALSSGSSYLSSVSTAPNQSETNETEFVFPTIENILSQNELPTITNTPPCLETESCNKTNENDPLFLTQLTIQNTLQEDLDGFLPLSDDILAPPQEPSEDIAPYFSIDVPIVQTTTNLQPVVESISADCEDCNGDCGGDCGKEGHCADAFICTLMKKGRESVLRGDPSLYPSNSLENEDSFTELFTGERKENSNSFKEVASTTIVKKPVKCNVPLRKSSRLNKDKVQAVNTFSRETDVTGDSSPVRLSVGLENSISIFHPNSDDDNEPTGIPGFTNTMYDDISKSLASPWGASNTDASCSDSEMNRLSGALENGQMEEILQTGSKDCISQPSTSRREELIEFLEMQKANEPQDPVTDELLHRGRKPMAGPPRLGKNMELAKIFCSSPLPSNSKVSAKQLRRQKREERTRKLSLSAQKRTKEKPTLNSIRGSQKGPSRLFSNPHAYPSIKPCYVSLEKLTETNIENIARELKVKILNKSLLSKTAEELIQNTDLKSEKLLAGRSSASGQSVSKSSILCSGRSYKSYSTSKPTQKPICNTTSAEKKAFQTSARDESQKSIENRTLSTTLIPKRGRRTRSSPKDQTVSSFPSEPSQECQDTNVSAPLNRRDRSKKHVLSEGVVSEKPGDLADNKNGCLGQDEMNEAIRECNDESNLVLEQPLKSCLVTTPTSLKIMNTPPQNCGRLKYLSPTKMVITKLKLLNPPDFHTVEKPKTSSNNEELKVESSTCLKGMPTHVGTEVGNEEIASLPLCRTAECGGDSSPHYSHEAACLEHDHKTSLNVLSEKNTSPHTPDHVRTTNSSNIPTLKDSSETDVGDLPQINQQAKSPFPECSDIAVKSSPEKVSKVKTKAPNIKKKTSENQNNQLKGKDIKKKTSENQNNQGKGKDIKKKTSENQNNQGKGKDTKKKTSEKCSASGTDSSSQRSCVDVQSSLPPENLETKENCEVVETETKVECEKKSHILTSRRGSSSSDTLHMIALSKAVADKHKAEELPKSLKNFKIPKRDSHKPDNAYSTQACSPLTTLTKDVNVNENPKSYLNTKELLSQKTEANKPSHLDLMLPHKEMCLGQVVEETSSDCSVISMDIDFTLNPDVEESDEIIQPDGAFAGSSASPKCAHSDTKRKSPEPLDECSAGNKRRLDIASTSNNHYLPQIIGSCKVETPRSVAHWFAQPFAPWSFWSPCTSPKAHHHAHLFSPPRPVSPKDKSSQLDLPTVGHQGCMLTEGDVMKEQSTTVIKSFTSLTGSSGDMFSCSPCEVAQQKSFHQDLRSPVVLKLQDSSQDQSILDMFSEESKEQEDMNFIPYGSKETSEHSERIDTQSGDLHVHTLSLTERVPEIDEATSNMSCDQLVQGSCLLKPLTKHTFVFTQLNKPPSKREVIDSLSLLNIPEVINEKPFYSNFLDVKGKMEVGGNVLDLNSKSFCHLEEFHSSIPGLAGLLDQQKQVFESLWGISQVKNCFNQYMMNHSEMRGVSVVPVRRPPLVHDVIIWCKARQILHEKVGFKSTTISTNQIIRKDADPISESVISSAVLKREKLLFTEGVAQASTPVHLKVFQNNEILSPHLTPIMLTSEESHQSSTNNSEKEKRSRKKVIPYSSSLASEIEADGDLGVRPLETQSIPLHFGINNSHDNSAVKQLLADSQFCRDAASPFFRNESNASACQVKGVNSSPGFKMVLESLQSAKTLKEHQYITTMTMEIHICTCGTMNPDPERDSIRAIFYTISNDIPNNHKIPSELAGIIAVDDSTSTTPLLGRCGIDGLVEYANDERALLGLLVGTVRKWDPDIICGFEIEMLSWGYVLQRASVLGMNLIKDLSRIPNQKEGKLTDDFDDNNGLSGLKITGRIALDVWRLFRSESYTFENLVYHILHQRVSRHSFATLSRWWENPTCLYRWMTVRYYQLRVQGVLKLLDQLDIIGRTSELARLFGIQFFEVLSRGSQFRVESMMLRLAKPLNYIPVSPSVQQRAHMRAPECLPLIMEPESRFYRDPVIVLDFQSLYPSMIIAYNYCFSTCLGRIEHLGKSSHFEFGCTELRVKNSHLQQLKDNISVSPSGVAFVSKSVRQGILPRMLEEILEARLAVKQSMKHHKNDHTLQRVLHARQLGLKLIANVTYGYTSANFSGRMPCIEIGDSIVSKGRETLERAISLVQGNSDWRARVVYGDTDSLFVLVPGRSRREAFRIGEEIAAAVTQDNPTPVKLKLEKVYQPSILQTKKRYVGFMYESPDQSEPIYEAKGIETVRRDGCPAVAKILEKSLRILFETSDVSTVKNYVTHQFTKILSGRANIQDLIFAKEYRGKENYRQGACVPALELTKRWLRHDRRAEPRIGERVPYVIVNGPPGSALINLVRHPNELLSDPSLRYNGVYYVTRAIIPPLARCLSLLGADVSSWYENLPRKNQIMLPSAQTGFKKTISQYFTTMECTCCGDLTNSGVCEKCRANPQLLVSSLTSKIHQWETTHLSITKICQSCLGRTQPLDCCSLDCPITYRRHQSSQNKDQSVFVSRLLADFLNLSPQCT